MPDGLPPLILPQLPFAVARPSRDAAPIDAVLRRRILLLLLIAHLLAALLIDRAMRLRALPAGSPASDAFEIVFLDPAPVTVTAIPAPTSAATPVVPQPVIAQVAAPEPPPVPAAPRIATPDRAQILSLQLFDADGSPQVSQQVLDAAAPAADLPDFAPPAPAALAPIRSPIPYKPTRFDAVWVPSNEALGDEIMRRVVVEKEFKTPWGTRWRCAWILIIGACGDVPPPAMKNPPKAPWETYEPEPPDREVDF